MTTLQIIAAILVAGWACVVTYELGRIADALISLVGYIGYEVQAQAAERQEREILAENLRKGSK